MPSGAEVRNLDNRGFIRNSRTTIGSDGVPVYNLPRGSRIRGVTTTNFVDVPFLHRSGFHIYAATGQRAGRHQ